MVELQPSKLATWVQSPSPAHDGCCDGGSKATGGSYSHHVRQWFVADKQENILARQRSWRALDAANDFSQKKNRADVGAEVAQSVERMHGKHEVTGPIPVLGSNYSVK